MSYHSSFYLSWFSYSLLLSSFFFFSIYQMLLLHVPVLQARLYYPLLQGYSLSLSVRFWAKIP